MAALDFETLKTQYGNFHTPIIELMVGDKKLSEDKNIIGISDVNVEVTAGFEASQAVYTLYNVYDILETEFLFDAAKKYIQLGTVVKIYAGYGTSATEIFRGIITKVNFLAERNEMPGIQVTAMDVKSIMMANSYNRQLSAKTYGKAVKEIFDQSVYQTLQSDGAVSEYSVAATPDEDVAGGGAGAVTGALPGAGSAGGLASGTSAAPGGIDKKSDKSIEMVAESDYEFVVKVAKKFNYDFFVVGGQVVFRKAKSDSVTLIDINNETMIRSLNVEYDITGLVGSVEVRGLDASKASLFKATLKNSNKISTGSKAKSIISGSKYVYVDPTVSSNDDAKKRAEYLMENISYRFGTLELVIIGLPEIIPGRFMTLSGFGTGASNTFYIQTVRHMFDSEGTYTTKIIGKAAKLASDLDGAGAIAGAAGGIL